MRAEIVIYDEVGNVIERHNAFAYVWVEIEAKADFLFDTCEDVTKDFFIITDVKP